MKNTFIKTIILGMICTLTNYTILVIYVDLFHVKYYVIGAILIPGMFLLRYLINKHWVFKE